MTTDRPKLGEILLGTEGLALLRLAFTADDQARSARVAEIRALLEGWDHDPALSLPAVAKEFDIGEGYARWSTAYDQPLRLFPLEEPLMRTLFQSMPQGTVLDAACGTGRHSVTLKELGHTVIGIDQSPDMLTRARAKLPDQEFKEGSLEALPLPDGSIDHTVCALAMVHLADVAPTIKEFARTVRPGGRVIISDVHPFMVMLSWQAQFQAADASRGFIRLYPHLPSEYCAAFAETGLQIRQCFEPRLTVDAAVTAAAERLPEANRAAWVGLPGVLIWDLQKPS